MIVKCAKAMRSTQKSPQLLFYMVLSRQKSCRFNRSFIEKTIQKLCSEILAEVLTIANQGFPQNLRDLMMEQIFLCSFAGFHDFLNSRWIAEISSWQDESGCFATCIHCTCSDHMTGVGAALLAIIFAK